MKTKYVVTKERFKKVYLQKLRGIDIFYFILATLLYFFMTYPIMKYNVGILLGFYLIYLLLFLLIIVSFNHLYTHTMMKFSEKCGNPYGEFLLEIKDNFLYWGTKKEKITIDLKKAKKVKCKKNFVSIYTEENQKGMCFTFYKEFFIRDDFLKFQKQMERYLVKKD